MERMGWRLWVVCTALLSILLAGMPAAGYAQPTPRLNPADDAVEQMIAQMTVEERVGQLFLVTFIGNQAPPDSDIAELIQTYRVGGVVLLASNGNIVNRGNTPHQTAELVNQLQQLALSAPPLESKYPPLPPAGVITPTQSTTPTGEVHVPLFIAVDHEGDGYPYTRLRSGFTPVPSNMAIGATWSPALAEAIGTIVGTELRAVGINMLLGPSLDVLDTPRPGGRGDMGIRTFGGDPYWVSALGEAYIRGVHLGSAGGILTVAKHFPGNGGSDRRPDEEISTVNKSLKELYRIELAPFFAVTKEPKLGSPSVTDALMTSHIRYRGFQGNIRQLTRPISFDAQNLPALMQLPEFAPWRDAGGLLVSDALGVPAVRKYYDPQLQTFPYRQIAQEAFLAGNDLLTLSQFALHDDWTEQFENIKATITFFQEKYVSDANFRARVDDSLRRILALKLRLYPSFSAEDVLVDPNAAQDAAGEGLSVVSDVAKQALTLIYPGPGELADRLPSPPLSDEPIVIFTDVREVSDCPDAGLCPSFTLLGITDFEEQIMKLYGPAGTGQVRPERITSFRFADLWAYLHPEAGESSAASRKAIESALADAQWVVFVMLDIDPTHYPASAALRDFLREGETLLRNKNVLVFAMAEPYYLDTTEISKLTAYYGLYSKMPPFIEVAVRTLFQEITPRGASPVSIAGINYDLISVTEPDPDQIIQVRLNTPAGSDPAKSVDITVG
ncbi:MAG: glycoside hydrolase family 3 protein, partial [Anaerolineae bacterium]